MVQNEAKSKAIGKKTIFYSYANKTLFHEKGFALASFEREIFRSRKLPIRTSYPAGADQIWEMPVIFQSLTSITNVHVGIIGNYKMAREFIAMRRRKSRFAD